jgi:Protein of unknown function (DUF1236)
MRYALLVTSAFVGIVAGASALAQTSSTTVTTTAPGTTGAITFAPEQRTVIRQRLTKAKPVQLKERVIVGMTVPSEVELVEVPEAVVTEVPTVRTYRYFRYNDDVVLVDPSTRRVVQILD